jgi:cellobiose phosphorylase
MMAERFNGVGRNSALPLAVVRGNCSNSDGVEPYAGLIAGAQFNVSLLPGESQSWELSFGLVPASEKDRARYLRALRRHGTGRSTGQSRTGRSGWKTKVNRFAIQTGDVAVDRYFNIWSRYQARNQARFVRALDKVGYRDILQDLLGVCDSEPDFVRSRILEALQYQFPDGRAVRQYEKYPGGGHDVRMYHDSPAWLADLLVAYISETGDDAILEEKVPYMDAESLHLSTELATVYDHVLRGTQSLFERTGYHGLSAIGYGDWNDAISGIGGTKGVSIWLSCAAVFAAAQMANLADRYGRERDARTMRAMREEMINRINTHAWDGEWYIYAINDRGEKIGSRDCREGKIHLNVNTWALFSGVAAAMDREHTVWESLRSLETPIGHMLLSPPYTQASRDSVGRIADQAPGLTENASIYTHGEAFFLYALSLRGDGDEWLKSLRRTLPSEQVPDIASGPPHQQSNFFVGPDHPRFGENMFSGFTGSLAWYRRSFDHILGVIPCLDGLKIDPHPPTEWTSYRVRRTFRGCRINFHFVKTGRRNVRDGRTVLPTKLDGDLLSSKPAMDLRVEY